MLYFACTFLYQTQNPPPLPPFAPIPPNYYYVNDPRYTIYFEPNVAGRYTCNDICAQTELSICDTSNQPNTARTESEMNDLVSRINGFTLTCFTFSEADEVDTVRPYYTRLGGARGRCSISTSASTEYKCTAESFDSLSRFCPCIYPPPPLPPPPPQYPPNILNIVTFIRDTTTFATCFCPNGETYVIASVTEGICPPLEKCNKGGIGPCLISSTPIAGNSVECATLQTPPNAPPPPPPPSPPPSPPIAPFQNIVTPAGGSVAFAFCTCPNGDGYPVAPNLNSCGNEYSSCVNGVLSDCVTVPNPVNVFNVICTNGPPPPPSPPSLPPSFPPGFEPRPPPSPPLSPGALSPPDPPPSPPSPPYSPPPSAPSPPPVAGSFTSGPGSDTWGLVGGYIE